MDPQIKERIEMIRRGEVPKGYNKTRLGIVPDKWRQGSVGDILKIRHGRSQKKVEKAKGKYPILATSGEIGRAEKFLYNKPSVLIGRKGTIDRPQYMESPFWTIDTLFYSEIEENIEAKWVYYKFRMIPWRRYNEASGVPSLSASTIESIRLSIPTTSEQQAIAQILTTWDQAIQLKEQLINEKKEQKKGLMQKLFTGKVRLPGFDGPWNSVKLGEVADIRTGDKNAEDRVEQGKYPFFVRSEDIQQIDSYSYDGEAILIPGDGRIGVIYHYINGKFDYHQRVYKVSNFENIHGKYVYYYLKQFFKKQAMKYTAKATVDSLRMPMLLEMPIIAPDVLEQKAIANVLSMADHEIGLLKEGLALLRLQKKGLMQLLLTGIVRVEEVAV